MKKLLFCCSLLLTVSAFALNIDSWSKPKDFHHSNNFNDGKVWGYGYPIVVGDDKIVYTGYDRIEYEKDYKVLYRVCSLDNDGVQHLIKETPTANYGEIAAYLESCGFCFYYRNAAIPNSNSFIEFIFGCKQESDFTTTITSAKYRIGTVQNNDSITWSKLKDWNKKFANDLSFDGFTVTKNNNVVVVTHKKGAKSPFQYYCFSGKLAPNAQRGQLEIEEIKTTTIELDGSFRGLVSLKNDYVALLLSGSSSTVVIGKLEETKLLWGRPQKIIYSLMSSDSLSASCIKDQLAIPVAAYNQGHSFLVFYKINDDLTMSRDETGKVKYLAPIFDNQYSWAAAWLKASTRIITTLYQYPPPGKDNYEVYYAVANLEQQL